MHSGRVHYQRVLGSLDASDQESGFGESQLARLRVSTQFKVPETHF